MKVDLAGFVDGVPERFVPETMRGELIDAEHRGRYWWVGALVKGRRVLDAGCGTGYGSTILADSGAEGVIGIDIAEDAVEAAHALRSNGVRFEVADVRALPFEDASFDAIVSFEVIEHVSEHDAVLKEFARVLRPQGFVAVSSPNRSTYPAGNPHHVRELLPDELRRSLGEHFQHVRLFRQAGWITSAVLDDATFEADNGAPLSDLMIRKITRREPGSETYTVALASDSPLDELPEIVVMSDPVELRRLAELEALAAERKLLLDRLADAEQALADRHELAREVAELASRVAELEAELTRLNAARIEAERVRHLTEKALGNIVNSPSWRITAPLRAGKRLLRGASQARQV